MIQRIKRIGVWIAVIPAIIGFWSTISMTVIYADTLFEIVELAAEKDPNSGLTGLQKYLQLYAQHQILWIERNDE